MRNIEARIYKHLPTGKYSLTVNGEDVSGTMRSFDFCPNPGNYMSMSLDGIELEEIRKISKAIYAAIVKEENNG